MTASSTIEGFAATHPGLASLSKPGALYAFAHPNLDPETKDVLSILGRTLFFLGLGTVAVVAVTGKLPLFFVPLGLFLFFGSALQWRQSRRAGESEVRRVCGAADRSQAMRDERRMRYTDTA